ncbi:MAG: DoxX family protein [Candidatus Omnitrophica bacterium]|nr:DoxX family protein [Candidatus Omnitrophota bacterium]
MRKENIINLSVFILRLMIGIIFTMHGAQKLFGMFNGIGLEGTAKMIEGLGFLYNPYLIAKIWAIVEFVGGLCLIFGILTRLAAAVVMISVIVFMYKASAVYGFYLQEENFENYLLVIGSCFSIVLLGGGNWSLWDV